MARRRQPGGVGGAASNPMLQLLMQHMLAQKRATAENDMATGRINLQDTLAGARQTTQQGIDTAQQMVPGLVSGATAPGRLTSDQLSALNMTPSDAVNMAPQNDTRPDIETLMKAKTQVDVPSFETMVSNVAGRGAGIRDLGPLNELGRLRSQTLDKINTSQELDADRAAATAKANAYNTGAGTEQATAEAFPAELARKLQEGQQSNTLAVDKETALNPVLTARAGSVAGATSRAQLAPDIVDAQINKFSREEEIRQKNHVPTDSQARAAGLLNPLVQSNLGLKELEKQRIDLAPGTQTFGDMPYAAKFVDPNQKALLQHAHNFLNIASLILTGVTARPDEYERYMGTMVAVQGDNDIIRAQKSATRDAFIKSVQTRAAAGQGGSIEEIMNEIQSAGAGANNTPNLPDGIVPPTDRQGLLDALETARSR